MGLLADPQEPTAVRSSAFRLEYRPEWITPLVAAALMRSDGCSSRSPRHLRPGCQQLSGDRQADDPGSPARPTLAGSGCRFGRTRDEARAVLALLRLGKVDVADPPIIWRWTVSFLLQFPGRFYLVLWLLCFGPQDAARTIWGDEGRDLGGLSLAAEGARKPGHAGRSFRGPSARPWSWRRPAAEPAPGHAGAEWRVL